MAVVFNMSALIYLENQELNKRGIKIQMGFMGQWIEIIKIKKPPQPESVHSKYNASFKRSLNGLQTGGIFI